MPVIIENVATGRRLFAQRSQGGEQGFGATTGWSGAADQALLRFVNAVAEEQEIDLDRLLTCAWTSLVPRDGVRGLAAKRLRALLAAHAYGAPETDRPTKGTYRVLTPDGLHVRAERAPSSPVLYVLQFGELFEASAGGSRGGVADDGRVFVKAGEPAPS